MQKVNGVAGIQHDPTLVTNFNMFAAAANPRFARGESRISFDMLSKTTNPKP